MCEFDWSEVNLNLSLVLKYIYLISKANPHFPNFDQNLITINYNYQTYIQVQVDEGQQLYSLLFIIIIHIQNYSLIMLA